MLQRLYCLPCYMTRFPHVLSQLCSSPILDVQHGIGCCCMFETCLHDSSGSHMLSRVQVDWTRREAEPEQLHSFGAAQCRTGQPLL